MATCENRRSPQFCAPKIFPMDNTTDDDWIQFSALSNHNLKDIKNMVINNQNDLNYYWNLIQKGILNAAYEIFRIITQVTDN